MHNILIYFLYLQRFILLAIYDVTWIADKNPEIVNNQYKTKRPLVMKEPTLMASHSSSYPVTASPCVCNFSMCWGG